MTNAGFDDEASSWLWSALFVVGLYSSILVVHLLMPSRKSTGYVCDPQEILKRTNNTPLQPLVYDLNGFRCFWIFITGFAMLHYSNQQNATLFLAKNYWKCAVVSNVLGLLTSYYFVYIRYPKLSTQEQKANQLRRAPTTSTNSAQQQYHPEDWDDRWNIFFNGREFNPRWQITFLGQSKTIDMKMFLYLIGALVLELNLLSIAAYEQELRYSHSGFRSNSSAMLLYACLFTWFVLDYLWYEEVHLYTSDIFAEKIGCKLSWGCLFFYPFFYAIGGLSLVMMDAPFYEKSDNSGNHEDLNLVTMTIITMVYVTGSTLTRGANMQKFHYRRHPQQSTLPLFGGWIVVKQVSVPSSKGRLLCSGFWGLSRHINYMGEILQASALALPVWWFLSLSEVELTFPLARWLPWLYPLYYIALFIPRQLDDEALMRQKYGDKIMDEYTEMVPYRMIPGVY